MGGIKLGKLLGFPIHINFSFLLLLGFAMVVWRSVDALVMLLATFVMVLLHELGHAVLARRLKVPIVGIELTFFGGVARMGGMPRTPRDEIVIAAAGPAVSAAMAGLSALLYSLLPGGAGAFFGTLAVINLMLACFNLLPALPMDGGRIFRAAMARRLGRVRATRIAVTVSRVLSVALAVWGILGLWPLYRPSMLLAALAMMLWFMAGAELRAAQFWSYFGAAEPPAPGPAAADTVEVLDSQGRPLNQGPDMTPHPVNLGQAPATSPERGFSVEEHRASGVHRWVVRGPDGEILFVSETPLRW